MPADSGAQVSVTDLVLRAQSGGRLAFDLLVLMYRSRICSYITRMVRDPVEAEDITQVAFTKAWRHLPSFRGDSTFETWLFQIARNLAIDSVRRRHQRMVVVSLDAPLEVEGEELVREREDRSWRGRPEQEIEAAELQRHVHRALDKLSPKLRQVVVLFELVGLSYKEVAAVVGCPEGTVKSRIYNARRELGGHLEELGVLTKLMEMVLNDKTSTERRKI